MGLRPQFKSRPTKLAQRLRNNATDVERILWSHLRGSHLNGYKFSRQMPIAGFVCDFLCRSAQLVVEVDGGQHAERVEQDESRTRAIEAEGYRVIRFWNSDVTDNLDGVLFRIAEALAESGPPPTPSRKR